MKKFTYDINHRIDVPTFVLSNVYHHQIGVINNIDIDSIQVNFNMNSQQEVSFDVYKELNGEKCSVWGKLKSLKYVFIPEHNEYYKADITIDDYDRTVKHVVMSSASEYELSNKIIRSLEINTDVDILRADRDETGQTPAYQPNILYNPSDTNNSILHRILADKAPDWSIAHVDDSIAKIQRTFSISNQKIYDCLTQTIAKEYDCLFQFDSVERTISCYDLLNQCEKCGKRGEFLTKCPDCGSTHIHKGYGKDTHIFITYNNFSEKITLDGDEAAVKNCFSVQGGDDTITSRVRLYNPNGSEYFYNFSEEDYEDMPEELVKKLEAYQDLYNSKKSEYEELAQNWTETLDEYYYYKTTMMPRLYDIKRWEKTKEYNVGDACYVRTLPSWCHLECVDAGKTGTEEPDLPYPTEDQIVEDGTVKWKVCKNILSLPTAQQSLNSIVEYFASNPIYFLNEIPTLKVVDNEVENMAGLQINNLFRIEIIDDENHKITDESPTPELGVYDPILSESTAHTPWDSRTDVRFINTGTWHYLKDSSNLEYVKDDWILTNDRWYYADTNGNIVFDCFVDGYRIDENGVCDFTKAVKNDDNTIDYLLMSRDPEHDKFIVQSGKWVYEGDDGTGHHIPFLHPWMNTYTYNTAGHKWYYINKYNEIGHSSIFVGETLEYNHRFYGFNEDYSWDGKTPTNYEGSRWQGNIRVYNTGNPDDEAKTTTPLSVYITVTKYMQQYTDYMTDKVQKRLDKKDITFTKIFDIPYDEAMVSGKYDPTKDTVFKDALKEYGLDSLSNFYKSYDGCMDVLRSNGVTDEKSSFMPFNLYDPLYTPYYGRQQLIKEEMAIRESTVNALKTKYEGYREEMNKINEKLNLEKYLGEDLINIFWAYTREDTYQNQNYVSTELSEREISDRTQELIKKATEELEKACKLQITLQDSVKNLFNTEEFKNYKDKFNIGDYIVVEVDDEWYRLRLITASFSYSSPDNITFTFSNATRLTNYFADAQSVIESAKSISGSYNAVVHQVEQSATVTEEVTDWVDNGLSSALANIMNNDNEEIIIDENGLTAREWNEATKAYNDEQFRITHNSIQFTDDAWKTSALGIGKNTYTWYNSNPNDLEHPLGWNTSKGYGVNAKFVTAGYISGTQIIGGDIYSDNYTVADPSRGIAADGSYIDLRNGNFTLGGGGLVGTRNSDGSYTLSYGGTITGHADVDVGSHLGTWTVYADGFYSGSSVLKPDNIFVTGNVRASDFIVGTGSGSYNLSTKISDIETNKQDLLTAGTNITIEKIGDDTVISATGGGGGGLEYWHETANRFYREGVHDGISGDEGTVRIGQEIGNYIVGDGWTRCLVFRMKNTTAPYIMGIGEQSWDTMQIVIATTNQADLDFEWGYSNNTLTEPYGVEEWFDKDEYTGGYDTASVTYNGKTWYCLQIHPAHKYNFGCAISGITKFFSATYNDDAATNGLKLLEACHAVDHIEVVMEVGTDTYAFKYGSSDKTYASIDTDGNAVFKELTTDAGTLTSLLATKQNMLTAGANVSINNNVISATDTTYSDFSGSTHGLVPAVQTQAGKFLKDDGTWETIQTGTEVEANPSDTATSTLLKLKVNNTVYSISGGGGGGGSFVGLTKAEYDALPTVDKEDTSKLYLVQEGGGIPVTEDLIMTSDDWSMYREGSMTINWVNSEIVFDWIGGSNIGGNIVKKVAIPANASKIKFKITTGQSYTTTVDRFRVFIGVRTTYQTGVILPYYSTTDWLAKTDFYTNNAVWEDELDLSDVTVDTYLYITAHGWDATVNYLEVVVPTGEEAIRHTYWNNSKWSQWNQVKEITQGEYNALTTVEKQDGSIYMTHDGGYDFINYDNGKIIVRINNTTGETIWYFNGYTKESADIDIPAELVPYIPTQTYSGSVLMCWAWTDDTSTTRNGAIGFLYPGTANVKLRSWNNDYSTLYGGTFWGTLIIDGAQEQQSNYSSPTEGLSLLPNRIYFNGTKYAENSASGGSGAYSRTVLYSTDVTSVGQFTLSDDITNYDEIEIVVGFTNGTSKTTFKFNSAWFKNEFPYVAGATSATNHFLACVYATYYIRLSMGDADNKLYMTETNSLMIEEVAGITY